VARLIAFALIVRLVVPVGVAGIAVLTPVAHALVAFFVLFMYAMLGHADQAFAGLAGRGARQRAATDVWIFKVAGTLDMAAAKNVILSGGALPQNIFWQVSGVVTIGANTRFKGIILGQTIINFGNLASIDGRLLAQSAVVLDATTVTVPQ